ncbi:hypothetical protein Tsubulata_015221 [Turnera subulata]|uniref:Uncharacterized protein n=1 Tax=Turnera subulata TaxID=218843 RepID=A0A9Q0FIT2_9ROSI|nr:hypothetical protein Tsubulata_015221 [Turnera subulata]
MKRMCRYQPWEDDSVHDGDHVQSTGHGLERGDQRLRNEIAVLAVRVANIETRLGRLEARMYLLQKALRVMCFSFLVTLAYAIFK